MSLNIPNYRIKRRNVFLSQVFSVWTRLGHKLVWWVGRSTLCFHF